MLTEISTAKVKANHILPAMRRVIGRRTAEWASEFVEGKGEEGGDGGEAVDFVFAGHVDGDVVTGEVFVLLESLTACAAGAGGLGELAAVGAAGGNSYGLETGLGITRTGIEAGRTLGAGAGGKGGVLLVGAGHYHAIVETYGRANVEVAVGCIGTMGCLAGCVYKFEFVGRQLVVAQFGDRYGYVEFLHGYVFILTEAAQAAL